MRSNVIELIEKEKLIVIVRGIQKEKLVPLAEAMYQGGIRLLEVTFDGSGKVSDEETAGYIQMLAEKFKGRMYIGAGTVLTEQQVELTKNAGGMFIISPNTDEKVIKKTLALNMVSMPGALTPTEVLTAHAYGADFVKLFPVGNLGASYMKAVYTPVNHVRLLAVGGVNEKNVDSFLKAGAVGVGVGGNLVNKQWIANGEFEKITALAEEFVRACGKRGETV